MSLEPNCRYIMYLLNYVEGIFFVFLDLMICNFPVKVDIVCQNKDLLDICAGDLVVNDLRIIIAYRDKLEQLRQR